MVYLDFCSMWNCFASECISSAIFKGIFAFSAIVFESAFAIFSIPLNDDYKDCTLFGPIPLTLSNIDFRTFLFLFCFWYVIAKRWASSLIFLNNIKPGEFLGIDWGSEFPGTKTSSKRLAKPITN